MLKSKAFKITISVLLVVLVALGVLALLIFDDPNEGKYSVEASSKLMQDIIVSTVTNKELTIDNDELNSGLIYSLKKVDNEGSVDGIYFDLNDMKDDGSVKLYIPVTRHSKHLGFSAYVKPELDTQNEVFSFKISNAKLGRLPISSKNLAEKIRKSEPDIFTCSGDTLYANAYLKYNIHSTDVKIKFDKFEIKDGQIIIKTSGLLKMVEDFLKEELFS